jgi:hypothetical protein
MTSEPYKVKKRKAIKVEQLPITETLANANECRIGSSPLGVYEPFTYTNYEWTKIKGKKTRLCVAKTIIGS